MKKILIFVAGYLPGDKSGGPVRTIANMVNALSADFEFYIVAMDRDLGDGKAYDSIKLNEWNKQGFAEVFYISRGINGVNSILNIIKNNKFDLIHLNSFFSIQFGFIPLLLARFFKKNLRVVVGPRGEFSLGALGIKNFKKSIFIKFFKFFKFNKNIIWHASSVYERDDIHRMMGSTAKVQIAVDIALPEKDLILTSRIINTPLNIIFISRIVPKKNLLGAIEILRQVKRDVQFDVYGPSEDKIYWQECLEAKEKLPNNIRFKYCGSLPFADVAKTLAKYDLFFLPTLGENFGHVIAEALSAGLPVLISDATPWRNLIEKKVGCDISLDQPRNFVEYIEDCCIKNPDEYKQWREKIRHWAIVNIGNNDAVEENRRLFMDLT